jgi:protein O-mannosyl-transferase
MGKKAARRKQEEVAVKKSATAKKPQVTGLTNRFVKIQALLIFLFAVLLYANTFTHDYAVDDMIVIQKNKLTNQGFAGIGKIMTTDAFYGFFGEDYKFVAGGRYRPLSIVTFAIEVEFFGQNPHISHVINSILYGVTCVLIFLLLLHLFKTHITEQWQLTIPLIAALLYTAHPLHTEAVANIKGRDEVMGMLFSVLTLLLSVKYIERKNMAMLLLTFGAFVLALLSKENAITYLAVVPLTMYFFTDAKVKDYVTMMVPMVVIAGIYVMLRQKFTDVDVMADTKEILNNPFVNTTTGERLATVAFTFWEYIRLLIIPHPLTHDYYYNQVPIIGWDNVKAILPFILNVGIVVWAITKIKEKNIFSYAILYYFITISIVSNILFTVGIAMNERFLFIPSLGFCIILAALIVKAVNYFKEKNFASLKVLHPQPTAIVLALTLIGYSAKTFTRNLDWENDFKLFAADFINSPNSAKIRNSYGGELVTRADKVEEPTRTEYLKKAEKVLGEALRIYPGYQNALLLMGNAKYKLYDSLPEAKYYYEQTIKQRPDYYEGNFNLGTILLAKKYYAEAIPYLKKSLIKGGDKYEPWFYLGDAYMNINNPDSAIYYYQNTLKLKPDLAIAYYKIGLCYAKMKGDFPNGYANLNKAIQLDPNNYTFYEDLGVAYGINKEYQKAIEAFERGIKVKPDYASFYNNIGITYKQLGDESKANEYFAKVQQLNDKK